MTLSLYSFSTRSLPGSAFQTQCLCGSSFLVPRLFSFIFLPLPLLNYFPFHHLPEFKKWDIVTTNTQSSVHINVNYFWECAISFPIWRRNTGFFSSFPVTFRFPLFPRERSVNHGRGPLGNLWGLSPSFTEPGQSHFWTQCFWGWLRVLLPIAEREQ